MIEEREKITILADAAHRGFSTEKLSELSASLKNGADYSSEAAEKIQQIIMGVYQPTGEHNRRGPDPADLSAFVSVGSILDVEEPNRPDLWEREIPQGSLVGISGQWGSMKSYLMQAMGMRAAQGQPFLGRRLREVDVFYFDKENPRSVWKRRLLDLAGQDRPERFHMMPLFGPFVPPSFDVDGVAFYSMLAELHPESLFIFDSLVRYYPSGKQTENTEDAIHAMTTLKTLTRWGTTVAFLHHPTKDGRDFRGGGDLQAAPDLLFTLTHDKKARRLILECTKNRFDEGHTLEISYEPTPEGGLVFVDVANAEEMKKRAEDRERTAAVLEIIRELYQKGESTKRRLFEEGKKRFDLGRRVVESIIDNGVGVTWTCIKLSTKHVYTPILEAACTEDMYTQKSGNAGNSCNDDEKERVHRPPSPYRGGRVHTGARSAKR
ncbi:MAG: AAA family ATPase [Syntrophorhabdales bacterium]